MSTLLTVTNILRAVDDSCIQFAAAGGFQVILDTMKRWNNCYEIQSAACAIFSFLDRSQESERQMIV
jgi:putative heme iron utilization protein